MSWKVCNICCSASADVLASYVMRTLRVPQCCSRASARHIDVLRIPVNHCLYAVAVLLFSIILGVGCSSAPYHRHPVDLRVEATDTTNRDMPVRVEVVYVYESALTDTLAALSASQWFRRRPKLAWRHPNGFDWWRWEWVPGQSVSPQRLPMVFFAQSVFVYAGYRSSGTHRDQVPPFRSFELELNRKGFQTRVVSP